MPKNNCPFCNPKKVSVGRLVYEDTTTYAILEEKQSALGYILVILKTHYDTILDEGISAFETVSFWKTVRYLGNRIKTILGAENVYVASLCDGVKHFHVHLIPRYKWTDKDKERYKELFTERDGKESVEFYTSKNTIGGFWYAADKERFYKETDFFKSKDRDKKLKELADTLRGF